MRLLAVTFLVLFQLSNPTVPPSNDRARKPEAENVTKQERADVPNPCPSVVIGECTGCFPENSPTHQQKQAETYDPRNDALYRRYLLATVIGVFGGFVGIGILIWQSVLLRRSANAAKESADAASRNAIAIINAERAWVIAKIARLGGTPTDYSLHVINYGRTIGRIIDFEVTYWCVPNDFRTLPETSGDRVTNKSFKIVLPPNELTYLAHFDIAEYAGDSWTDIQSGLKIGLFCWSVRYWDIVAERKQSHETRMYQSYSGYRSALVHLPEHDIYT